MMATPGIKPAYHGVPTSEPELLVHVAVASQAVELAFGIDLRNTHVESSDDDCSVRDRDDIVTIFDYNFLFLRNN
jgi:hypothetical protein